MTECMCIPYNKQNIVTVLYTTTKTEPHPPASISWLLVFFFVLHRTGDQVLKETLRNKLIWTWGWAEVLSIVPTVFILNRWCVSLAMANVWENAFFRPMASFHLYYATMGLHWRGRLRVSLRSVNLRLSHVKLRCLKKSPQMYSSEKQFKTALGIRWHQLVLPQTSKKDYLTLRLP